MKKAIIFDIQRSSFVDGPGIRTTVFMKGCNLRCRWCHNPESQSAKKQMMFYKDKCTGCGKCAEVCPYHLESCDFCGQCAICCPHDARQVCGKEYTEEELITEILKDKAFFTASGGGVTFSGGECMLQIDFLANMLKLCKENGIHTAVDTAGCVPWESFERVIPYTDMFLYDVKAYTDELHIEGVGVSNKLILENLTKLSLCFKGNILVRTPVMVGYNASDEEIGKIAAFVKEIGIKNVELMPYHKMGEHKYAALGMDCRTYGVPSDEDMARFKAMFV